MRSNNVQEVVHSYVCLFLEGNSLVGNRYSITFVYENNMNMGQSKDKTKTIEE